jgi:polysaccharide export outer membrane protein
MNNSVALSDSRLPRVTALLLLVMLLGGVVVGRFASSLLAAPVAGEELSEDVAVESPPIRPSSSLYAPSREHGDLAIFGASQRPLGSKDAMALYGPTLKHAVPVRPAWVRQPDEVLVENAHLYGPSCEEAVSPVSYQEMLPVDVPVERKTSDLYRPALANALPPKASRMQSHERFGRELYGYPSGAADSSHGPATVGMPAPSGNNALYAPSSPTAAFPTLTSGAFGQAALGNWDEGTVVPTRRVRRLLGERPSIYGSDGDALRLLFDLELVERPLEPPRELSKVSLPTYRIEPPDVIQLETIKLVPRPPYRIEFYDVLQINVGGALRELPITGYFLVEGEGIVSLGPTYGAVKVVGMTLDEAKAEITRVLMKTLAQPAVIVQLARSASTEQLAGFYQVQPDGLVGLRGYGSVHVTGKTIAEARVAVEQHLTQFFDSPQVVIDVARYNSKNYYVIVAGADIGESIQRFGMSGNETVLDAISQMQGLSRVSSKTMWVARATPGGIQCPEILPVDWTAITRGAMTDTNYQILPGDRLYIVDDKLVATGSLVSRITAPVERMLNISRLGASTITTTQTLGRAYNQSRRGG